MISFFKTAICFCGLAGSQLIASPSDFRHGVGIGIDSPEIFPVEWIGYSRYFGLRLFVTPPIPFNVRVEMPDDLITTANGFEIEHPALNFELKARYGPNYGMEVQYYPFAGSFFLSGGASFRKFSLKGEVRSPMIIRPKGSKESLTTKTIFGVSADATTYAWLGRVSMGWLWRIFESGYFKFTLAGYSRPYKAHTDLKVGGIVDAPGVENDILLGDLQELLDTKETELDEKARKEIEPAEKLALPIIGFTVGWLF